MGWRRGDMGWRLSGAAANPARDLYRRAGFEDVAEHGGSWTMRATL